MNTVDYIYRGNVTRVIDGDTFEATVDLGFKTYKKETFRLIDIDTPETWRPKTLTEKEHGIRATEFVVDLIGDKEIIIHSIKQGLYSRWLAAVYIDQDHLDRRVTLGDLLRENGFEKLKEYV